MFDVIDNSKELRSKLNLNQSDFWGAVGVTQSGGSRYEAGRKMPKPVRELLRIVHIEGVSIAKINAADIRLVAYIKKFQPVLYRSLKSNMKGSKWNR